MDIGRQTVDLRLVLRLRETAVVIFKVVYVKAEELHAKVRTPRESSLAILENIQKKYFSGMSAEEMELERLRIIRSRLQAARERARPVATQPLTPRVSKLQVNQDRAKKFLEKQKSIQKKMSLFVTQREEVRDMMRGFLQVYNRCRENRAAFSDEWRQFLALLQLMSQLQNKTAIKKRQLRHHVDNIKLFNHFFRRLEAPSEDADDGNRLANRACWGTALWVKAGAGLPLKKHVAVNMVRDFLGAMVRQMVVVRPIPAACHKSKLTSAGAQENDSTDAPQVEGVQNSAVE